MNQTMTVHAQTATAIANGLDTLEFTATVLDANQQPVVGTEVTWQTDYGTLSQGIPGPSQTTTNWPASSRTHHRSVTDARGIATINLSSQQAHTAQVTAQLMDHAAVAAPLVSFIQPYPLKQLMQLEQKKILTDTETAELIYSEKRQFYINKMLHIQYHDEQSFRVTNFVPRTFQDVRVIVQLSEQEPKIHLGLLGTIQPHTEYLFRYPFLEQADNYQTASGELTTLGPETPLLAHHSIFNPVSPDPLWQKLQEIKATWKVVFCFKQEEMTAEIARAYTALIPEYAYILSRPEYKQAFLQGRFGLWTESGGYYNPDGTDNLRQPLFNQEQLTVMYYKSLGIYDIGLINNGHPNDPDAQINKPGVITHKFGITSQGAAGGLTNSTFKTARISLSDAHFHYEDDGIFETLGHETGHVYCFFLKSLKLRNHESNMPHIDFNKGLGLLLLEQYRQLCAENQLLFSKPGVSPSVMMGMQPTEYQLRKPKNLCCQVEVFDDSNTEQAPARVTDPAQLSQQINASALNEPQSLSTAGASTPSPAVPETPLCHKVA